MRVLRANNPQDAVDLVVEAFELPLYRGEMNRELIPRHEALEVLLRRKATELANQVGFIHLGPLEAIESPIHVPFEGFDRHAWPTRWDHSIVPIAMTMPGGGSRRLRLI
jgi:hypothetical protein